MLKGARRIGKSTIAEEFALKEYKTYIRQIPHLQERRRHHIPTSLHGPIPRPVTVSLSSITQRAVPNKVSERLDLY